MTQESSLILVLLKINRYTDSQDMLVFACISPHPPLLLPHIGGETDRARVKETISSLEKLAPELAKTKPDLIIVSSPHPDWGIEVPLFFLVSKLKTQIKILDYQNPADFKLIEPDKLTVQPILTTLDSPKKHFGWGKEITANLPKEKRVAWIASGDMSHRLKKDGPYGLHPSGPKFDQKFIGLLKKKNIEAILSLNSNLIEEAGECGLRSFCLLLGALEEKNINWQPKILSYEGPFGVGYLVARLL